MGENSLAGQAELRHELAMTFQERNELERRRMVNDEGRGPG